MAIEKIYAHLSCSNLTQSVNWFENLFGRAPDARPMQSLAEWHHGNSSGFQLFEDASNAGRGTLTLIVEGLQDEHARLAKAGLKPGNLEPADTISVVRLHDQDKNLIVLAQAGRP